MTVATPCSRSRGKTRQRRREMRHCRRRSSPSGARAGSSWSSIGTVSPGNFLAGASSRVNRLVRQPCVNCWRRAGRSLTDRCGSSATRNLYWHPTSESNTWPCSRVTVPEPATFRPTRRPQPFTGGIFSKHSQGTFSTWTSISPSSRACPADRPTRVLESHPPQRQVPGFRPRLVKTVQVRGVETAGREGPAQPSQVLDGGPATHPRTHAPSPSTAGFPPGAGAGPRGSADGPGRVPGAPALLTPPPASSTLMGDGHSGQRRSDGSPSRRSSAPARAG